MRKNLLPAIVAVATLLACAGALLFAPAQSASASLATFIPVADAYVDSSSPSSNHGTGTTLYIDQSPTTTTYLRFAVQGLSSVSSATLKLYANSASSAGYSVYAVADNSWSETGLTYNNAPRPGVLLASLSSFSAGTWTSVDVTAYVKANGTFSFMLADRSGTRASLASRESGAQAAQLIVNAGSIATATPTPTQPPANGDPVIAGAGDIACAPTDSNYNGGLGTSVCHMKYTSDLLLNMNPNAVLTLGDNQYEQGELKNYQTSFDSTWGRLKAKMHPSVGNHEYSTSGATGYYTYFGAAAGDPSKGYYSYNLGAWHLIVLNSNCSHAGGCGTGSPQETWLRTDLAAHPAACTLAYWHAPRFSSGDHGDNSLYQPLWQALYDYHADVVLNGHDHDYERFALQSPTGKADSSHGIREFVVGTGGKNHTYFGTTQANSQVRNSDTFGVLKLTLHATSYDWRFLPEVGKTFTDSGSQACR